MTVKEFINDWKQKMDTSKLDKEISYLMSKVNENNQKKTYNNYAKYFVFGAFVSFFFPIILTFGFSMHLSLFAWLCCFSSIIGFISLENFFDKNQKDHNEMIDRENSKINYQIIKYDNQKSNIIKMDNSITILENLIEKYNIPEILDYKMPYSQYFKLFYMMRDSNKYFDILMKYIDHYENINFLGMIILNHRNEFNVFNRMPSNIEVEKLHEKSKLIVKELEEKRNKTNQESSSRIRYRSQRYDTLTEKETVSRRR